MISENISEPEDKYINILIDFGFKKLFGVEPNKYLLKDFLNSILPAQHQIKNLTYQKNEHLSNAPLDRSDCNRECTILPTIVSQTSFGTSPDSVADTYQLLQLEPWLAPIPHSAGLSIFS